MSTSIKLGVLGSTRGTDLQAIIDSIYQKELNATIEVVISNSSNAYILERAANNNIPNFFISHLDKTREEFDAEISLILKRHKVDLVLLIGFMRILSSKFCRDWKGRILNVHPSLLPKYAGGMDTNVHKEVIKNRDTETGCTIHYVTEVVDDGPILIQKKCSVDKNDTPESLKEKVQILEGEAFVDAIKLFQNNIL
jgi:formyltetrahydrofolate-dependent phosphoribosylglycinamide formyltransferase